MCFNISRFSKSLIHNLSFYKDCGYNLTMYYLNIRPFFSIVTKRTLLIGLSLICTYASPVLAQTPDGQTAQQSPTRVPETGLPEDKIREHAGRDIEYYMAPKNKRDCATRSNLFAAAVKKYKEGVPVNEVTDVKMFEPLFANIYAALREKGVDQASLDNMAEYQKCVDEAKPHRDPLREQDMAVKYGGCKQLNALILDTLGSIKDGKKVDTVLDKYKNKRLDLSGTQYEKVESPTFFFIGQLYKVAQEREYSTAVQIGSNMSAACMM